jgi:hypothetical protein
MLLLFPLAAFAGNSNTLSDCNAAATFARTVAQARDAGITSDAFRASIAGVKLSPQLKDLSEGMITAIYGDNNSLTPDQVAAAALAACMK